MRRQTARAVDRSRHSLAQSRPPTCRALVLFLCQRLDAVMSRLHELVALVRSHLGARPPQGAGPMTLPGLQIIANCTVTEAQQLVYEPMLCLILDGAKNTTLG